MARAHIFTETVANKKKLKGQFVITTTRPATSEAHDYTVRGQETKSPLGDGAAMRSGYQLKNAKKPRAKTHTCQCQTCKCK
eukprot:3903813-Pleurochrysis_carterae.AAC.2